MPAFLIAVALAAAAPQPERISLLREAGEPSLSVHHVPGQGPSVLYVHGSTFPAALSMNYRLHGKSWADDLNARGFDVWSFDLAGYGGSDRAVAPAAGPGSRKPLGRAPEAAREIERVVRLIVKDTHHPRVSIIAHSWGTIPAGLFAGTHPELVDRLVLFGPVAQREGKEDQPTAPTELVTADDQWQSFRSGIPDGKPLIERQDFDAWAAAYLATDPSSARRSPRSVEVPTGPDADFADAWSGHLPYDPSLIKSPTLLVRGEWDPIARDADVAFLAAAMKQVPGGAKSIKLPHGGHRMHLEQNRQALFDAVAGFLSGGQS